MRFLFLNQYAPPEPVPTARLLGELAAYLRGKGHEVEIVSRNESYLGRPARGGGRLRRELGALGGILRGGWSQRRPPPEVILSLSSPPGLLVVAAILARRHRARLAHWAMDLYPNSRWRWGRPDRAWRFTDCGERCAGLTADAG